MSTTSYFSNHSSQSRFLAISGASPSPSSVSGTTASAPSSAPTPSSNAPGGHVAVKRAPSKHFSTSVAAAADKDKDKARVATEEDDEESAYGGGVPRSVHPLRNTWVFWFRQQRSPGNKILSYEEGIKRVAAFSSVESFWALHTHLASPSQLTPTTDYLLFHAGVIRPIWEDPLNASGGKWIVRLRKGVADRVWEALVCAVVGDFFSSADPPPRSWEDEDGSDSDASVNPSASPSKPNANNAKVGGEKEEPPEICGCTISVRQSEDIISLWNRVDGDVKARERIRDTLRQVLGLPASTVMEYKSNNDSLQDKSSFHNSTIDRTPGV
ncbi:translation initiation factor eIF 4e-like domain-containing protein [Mycena vitilis]|nr:translation initiation factor eIF 4e-like domain-containing protein [Mycena vitilis]